MVMAEKEKSQAARLVVQKNACGWYVPSKSPLSTPCRLIHSCSGKINVPQESVNYRWGDEVDLKRGGFLVSPAQLL